MFKGSPLGLGFTRAKRPHIAQRLVNRSSKLASVPSWEGGFGRPALFTHRVHLANEHRSGARKLAVRASLSDASYPRLILSLCPGCLASKPDDIARRSERLGVEVTYHRTSATTLSAAGVGSDSSPVRVMSSIECSVMYFE